MKGRIAAAAVLGGLTLFAWGAVSHMVFQLGDAGLRVAPVSPGDQAFLDAVKTTMPESGMYLYPGMDESKRGDEAAMNEWTERTKAEPHGIIVVKSEPYAGMGGQLLHELLMDVAFAALASVLLCCGAASSGFAGRWGFVTGLGLVTAFRPIQLCNWFHFPPTYTHAQILDGVLGFAVMGLVLAAIVKRPGAAKAPGA